MKTNEKQDSILRSAGAATGTYFGSFSKSSADYDDLLPHENITMPPTFGTGAWIPGEGWVECKHGGAGVTSDEPYFAYEKKEESNMITIIAIVIAGIALIVNLLLWL